jgi:hypothetical protein
LRADPEESGGVLRQGRGGEVGQSLGLPVHLERIALRQTLLAQTNEQDERHPQRGAFPRIGPHLSNLFEFSTDCQIEDG